MRAADRVTKFLDYGSGQTLYEKLKRRSCSELMFGYGRRNLRKVAAEVQGGTRHCTGSILNC